MVLQNFQKLFGVAETAMIQASYSSPPILRSFLYHDQPCPSSFSLFVIAGPCVIESGEFCLKVGNHVKKICDQLGLGYIFKASFDKANRSSNASFRGPGLEDGLVVLERVKARTRRAGSDRCA